MNPTAQIIQDSDALECLAACERAYATCTVCSDDCNFLIEEMDSFIRVTARGSKSAQDWLSDFDARLISVSGGRVHEGIWRSYQPVSTELRRQLKKLSRKPLIVPGHSRGHGHACYAAFDLFGEYDIASVVTFGGMKFCDGTFSKSYNAFLGEITLRFVNARDIVPRVPPEPEYAHVGHEGFLTSRGTFEYDPGFWELVEDDIVGGLADIKAGKLELLDDHHLERYKARLESVT